MYGHPRATLPSLAWDDEQDPPAEEVQPLIHGSGTPETVWAPWLANATLPKQTLPHWLPSAARLIVVAPHPDDEVLACGALLAMHAARGGSVLLIAVTDGEASHPPCAARSEAQLASIRRQESVHGWLRLGLQDAAVIRLGIPDGFIGQHSGQLNDTLRRCLRPTDVVVSTWRRDGHPDHEACGFGAAKACLQIGSRLLEAPVWMWHWAQPGDARVPWHRLQCLDTDPSAWARKQTALAAHQSQLSALAPHRQSTLAQTHSQARLQKVSPPHTGQPAGSVGMADADLGQQPILGTAILARARRQTEYFFV